MDPSTYTTYAVVLAAGLAAGFGLGLLRNRRNNRRLHELGSRLETANKERERAESERAAAREALQRLQKQHDDYRGLVADHFAGASERLREFTLQYRAVYQHLAEGASALCPESFPALEGSFEALPSRREGSEGGDDDA